MIAATLVKELRAKTGAGMMDCKRALEESGGQMAEAIEILRKSGIAKAEQKIGRSVSEGVVTTYIHPGSKLGVLLEVNCETDFVANTEAFQRFVKDVAMQVAAAAPLAIYREEIDTEVLEREKRIYNAQAERSGKPATIIAKMVAGRLNKFYSEKVLLEQPFVKDPSKSIDEYLKETIAILGENIVIARFARFHLGEESSRDGSA